MKGPGPILNTFSILCLPHPARAKERKEREGIEFLNVIYDLWASKAQAGKGEGKVFGKVSARAYVQGATLAFVLCETSVRMVERWDRTLNLPNPIPTLYY